MTEAVAAPVATDGAPQVTPTPTPAEVRKFMVKVNGADTEVDEAELLRGYSHSSAANEKMRAAQEQHKMAEEVLRIFKTDPKLAFSKLGVDAKEFAEKVLSEHLEDSMLTDEQKELKKLRAWQSEQAKKQDEEKSAQEAAAAESYREQVGQELNTHIVNAIQASGLPKNQYTVGRLAYHMEAAVQAGFTDLPVAELIRHILPDVKAEYDADLKSRLMSTPDDQLLDFLGEEVTKRTLKAHLAKVGKGKKDTGQKVQDPGQVKTTTAKKDIKSPKDFFKRSWQR